MIIDFRLTVFITVAHTRSFTRAAAELNISQPAVSRHIKELETDFGEALFDRKGSSIALTTKGNQIVPLVESILDGYNALCDTIKRDDFQYEGLLHVGASTTIAQYVLPELLAKFNKQYPRIRLSLINANSDEVVRMLQRRQIDIALIEGNSSSNSVHYTPFLSDEIVLVSTVEHKRMLRKEQIEKLPLIIREDGSGTLSVTLSALRERGISRRMLNIKMQLGSSEAILRYIRSSKDYAFVSTRVAEEYIKRGELFINEVEGLRITRLFRYASLHGHNGRLTNAFKEFCNDYYNI
ncbi:MAG: LysR substrate-binding domain-containing protein [Rikenellaceae bacterium]